MKTDDIPEQADVFSQISLIGCMCFKLLAFVLEKPGVFVVACHWMG